ncbi:hypothetical protein PYW08_007834 [Mythimna loreyi]|uniref:Uncharacterized protein n=1 Tax=Mythimna loreyi TaxID=667449 RepID=A0ACC2QCZ7_9NEOP|nr:hypothetical protein PYW08_007834 [Mythimna loreyi]
MADLLLKNGATNVYMYVFSYEGGRNAPGIFMSSEINYLLDDEELSNKTTPEDMIIIDIMTTLWTNFAVFGVDKMWGPKTGNQSLPTKWIPITKTTRPYLDINLDLTLKSRAAHDKMKFWDMFYRLYKDYLR